jgi:hypothetical protein
MAPWVEELKRLVKGTGNPAYSSFIQIANKRRDTLRIGDKGSKESARMRSEADKEEGEGLGQGGKKRGGCAMFFSLSAGLQACSVINLTFRFGVNPVPFMIMQVFATNIGSSATVVG